VVIKILRGAYFVLRDLGLDSPESEVLAGDIEFDPEGIDILCQALMRGMLDRMVEKSPVTILVSEYWYQSFWQVLQMLRQYVVPKTVLLQLLILYLRPRTEGLLPGSWAQVSNDKLNELIPPSFKADVIETSLAT
jgi:hypothetical protein